MPFDSLISFIGRDSRTASDLWGEIAELRRINGPDNYRDLPADLSVLQRQLRAGKVAGLLVEDWPDGATEATWRPGRTRQRKAQQELAF